jgi:uncharacterized protein with FMN-binding domain
MVTGPAIATPHGVVQVRISVTGNRLTDIVALQYAVGGRSTEINEWAIPLLRQEALSAQNARLHTLSGATYTSNAYKMSLQAALDAAAAGRHD